MRLIFCVKKFLGTCGPLLATSNYRREVCMCRLQRWAHWRLCLSSWGHPKYLWVHNFIHFHNELLGTLLCTFLFLHEVHEMNVYWGGHIYSFVYKFHLWKYLAAYSGMLYLWSALNIVGWINFGSCLSIVTPALYEAQTELILNKMDHKRLVHEIKYRFN